HGGRVVRFQGDGFKAVFGLPIASEYDPDHAVLAGLAILAVAREVAAELEQTRGLRDFAVRVGVASGLVLAGGLTEGEDTVKGEPVNLAARLEQAAQPGTLLIAHTTYQHVRGVFDVQPLGPMALKGCCWRTHIPVRFIPPDATIHLALTYYGSESTN
ncbi:MAG: adenylate/guanylate cyclase domain-containing protein, partial [Chloroflexota bacterium]|nr:adenylate/guanylate cyclase domain-containing protein [Chloroflexota bacterium]